MFKQVKDKVKGIPKMCRGGSGLEGEGCLACVGVVREQWHG